MVVTRQSRRSVGVSSGGRREGRKGVSGEEKGGGRGKEWGGVEVAKRGSGKREVVSCERRRQSVAVDDRVRSFVVGLRATVEVAAAVAGGVTMAS